MKALTLLIVSSFFLVSQLWAQAPATRTLSFSSLRVIAVGDFLISGPIPYKDGMTLVEAVAAAGGLHDVAKGRLYLIRCGKSQYIDVQSIIRGAATSPVLQPWDILYLNP